MINAKSQDVCAVIVTYNRKELLLECIKAVQSQTKQVETIYIIDNASSDGTQELLKKNGFLQDDTITYIRMEENTGGAGGFYAGMKRGYKDEYSWIWVMDDDGAPDSTCLEELLKKDGHLIRGPLVVQKEDPSKLSFGFFDKKHSREITTVHNAKKYQTRGCFEDALNPFNGILYNKEVIGRIGLPKAEMFIWGDEKEYTLRARKNGIKMCTVIDAIHRHPTKKISTIRFLNFHVYNQQEDFDIRDYCKFRNEAYINWTYKKINLLRDIIKYSLFFIFKRRKLSHFMSFLNAFRDGIINNFEKHKDFLN